MNRIQLTRAEAVALLMLTGAGAERALRNNRDDALRTFPGYAKAINATSVSDTHAAVFRLVETVKAQLAEFNEQIIASERAARERAERAQLNDMFYKNVTGLLKKLNDTAYLTGAERLTLATARYPEADIRANKLEKLEYFGRLSGPASAPACPPAPPAKSLSELLRTKLGKRDSYPAVTGGL